MTTFDDKEKAEENKYAHDKEMEFRIHARRNKLLGLWVAEKAGLTGKAAEEYAAMIATIDLGKISEETVFTKVKRDLIAKSVHISDHDIRAQMHHFLHQAREQLVSK
jgi:hypothetical protein